MLKLGENILDGKVVILSQDTEGKTVATFPSWREPITNEPFSLTFTPKTTLGFISQVVNQLLSGDFDPFSL